MPQEQVQGVSIHGKAAQLRGGATLSIETKEPWCLPYLDVLRSRCKFTVVIPFSGIHLINPAGTNPACQK